MAEEVEMTPISMDEVNDVPPKVAPFGGASAAAKPEPAKPAPAAAAPSNPETVKLKPVIRKPSIHRPTIGGTPKPPAPVAPAAAPAAPSKKATQNLKSVTGPIPMAASLKKTGIIAEGIITPAQQQASKSKTSRISLESAIGVSPAKEGPAPLKTIRLRRPTDLNKPAAPSPVSLIKPAAPAPTPEPLTPMAETPAMEPIAPAPEATVAELPKVDDAEVTQKKTLKLHRPDAPISRPSMGMGAPAAGDVASAPAPAALNPSLAMGMVEPEKQGSGVPTWLSALSLITAVAALVVIGLVSYYLWTEGVGPQAGANEMQFLNM